MRIVTRYNATKTERAYSQSRLSRTRAAASYFQASFVIGTVLVGFAETMSSMQVYCKAEHLSKWHTVSV